MRCSGIERLRAGFDTGSNPGTGFEPASPARRTKRADVGSNGRAALPPRLAKGDEPSGVSIHAAATVACVALSLTACKTAHVADFLATPADRLVCEAAGPRPKIPPEYQIDWGKVATVGQAQGEVGKLMAVEHQREAVVAGYVLQTEGKLSVCFVNMTWRKQYEAELAKNHLGVKP